MWEKNEKPHTNIVSISIKAAVYGTDLIIVRTACWIEASTTTEITEQKQEDCILVECQTDGNGEVFYLINETIVKFSMNMVIMEAEDRVWSLHRDHMTV